MENQPHILYVEDDSDTPRVSPIDSESAGLSCSVTGDSSEVLNLLAAHSFDALLLDNWMPNLDGIELCRLIRSVDQKILIFFCSGALTEADKKSAFAAGAQGYIGKPFDADELTTTLRAALNTVQP